MLRLSCNIRKLRGHWQCLITECLIASAVHPLVKPACYMFFDLPPECDCIMLTVLSVESRGVENAQEETAPAIQAEASEEAAPAAANETNGPTPEEEAEAEAKVS